MNPGMTVVFERDYEPELVRAVLDDIEDKWRSLEDGAGYHLGDDVVDYIAEVEGDRIRIPYARWFKETYVYEMTAP